MTFDARITSAPGLLRRCVRCGHFECPFCGAWCDVCLDVELEGHHEECANALECLYDAPRKTAEIESFKAEASTKLGGTDVVFGETKDGAITARRRGG